MSWSHLDFKLDWKVHVCRCQLSKSYYRYFAMINQHQSTTQNHRKNLGTLPKNSTLVIYNGGKTHANLCCSYLVASGYILYSIYTTRTCAKTCVFTYHRCYANSTYSCREVNYWYNANHYTLNRKQWQEECTVGI